MVEVKQHRPIVTHLQHCARVAALAVGRGELHHIAYVVLFVRVAQLVQQLLGHPLLHIGIALAKSLTGRHVKRGARAFGQAQEALLHGGRQLAGAQRQSGGFVGKSVDHIPRRAGQAVVQREEGARLNGGKGSSDRGHESPDKLACIVENRAKPYARRSRGGLFASSFMPLKDLPADAQPREKLLARGPAALADAELLAILLRTGIVGKGVLQMAQELLDPPSVDEATGRVTGGFGGIAGLLHTSAADLTRIKGLGPAKRAELVAVLELARRALAQQLREREVFDSPDAVKHYLQLHLAAKGHEVFAVLFLDSQNRLLAMEELFRGTLTQTSVYPREVVLRALHHQAAAVVLAHNHPSGSVEPSRADEALTQTLKTTLALVDVRVLDHVIVAPGQALSMADKGLM